VFDHLARLIAEYSLLSIFVLFSVYTAAYLVLTIRFKIPRWTTACDFQEGKKEPWFKLLTLCQALAFLTPLSFVGFVASVEAATTPDHTVLADLALAASIAFAVLSSVYYFVQFTLAGRDVSNDDGSGMEHLFQLNPGAVFTSVNILGWTLFFGIACLCLAPLFHGSAGRNAFGALLLANGVVCFAGLAGYLWKVRLLNVLYFNVMGLAVLAFSILGYLLL
jgi:hypothetical protein